MKSARAAALRLIFPLLLRLATVDFFGIDDFLEADDDLVEVLLVFNDSLRDPVDDEGFWLCNFEQLPIRIMHNSEARTLGECLPQSVFPLVRRLLGLGL
jgi:hypothetical protein